MLEGFSYHHLVARVCERIGAFSKEELDQFVETDWAWCQPECPSGINIGAVMLVAYPHPETGELMLVFTERVSKGKFPGMYVLAGGHLEKTETTEEAARREAQEELGFDTSALLDVTEIGAVQIVVGNYWIHGFFGYTDTRPNFVRQETEVEKIIELPASELLSDDIFASKERHGIPYRGLRFKRCFVEGELLENCFVFGSTALFLGAARLAIISGD